MQISLLLLTNNMTYKAESIFTGEEILNEYAVIVENSIIQDVLPQKKLTEKNNDIIDLGNVLLTPAFIDIQLYGAHNKLLAVFPNAETIEEIVKYSAEGGAAWCLPTVATNTYEVIFKCIDAVREYWSKSGKGVIGLHVEGPWLNPVKRGAHKEEWIFSPSIDQARELLDYGKGVIKMITLAPECVSKEVINLVQSYNIIVSAGHSNATYKQAMEAFDEGICNATHLYNAMSSLQHRAPGLVGAIFNHPSVMCSLVPDGHHVDFSAIKIAKKIMGNRLFAITDAVTETNEGYYQHHLEGDKYVSNGILSGSALTMYKSFLNLVNYCDISVEEALRMCSIYPAKALQMQEKIGVISKGAKASMLIFNKDLSFARLI